MIASVKEHGGYARRLEDQYGVGIYDTVLIPKGLPVFVAEVKIIRSSTFGPTPRQLIELNRVVQVAVDAGHVIPVVIGFRDDNYYFHTPKQVIDPRDCFSVTTSDMPFHHQLVHYYHSIRK